MKKHISIYLLSLLTSIFICSCSDDFTTAVYDLGSKTFDEPFVGFLKNKPAILEKSLKYPPFSWFTSDTVSFRKDFEVTFNEECLRSKTEVTFCMTDSLNQMYKGADIFYNGKKIEYGRFTLIADSLVKNINLEYIIRPQLGDYTSIGNIQITAKELDRVNGLDLSQEAQIVGIWQCQQEIGWPIMIWLLWLVILIALIALIVYVLYLLYQAFVFLFTRGSLTKQVNADSQFNNKKNTDKKKEKKKERKEKEEILDEWIRIPKEELSSELFEFVARMKKRTGGEFFNSLKYYRHRDYSNKFKILSMYNTQLILHDEDVYCTIGNNKNHGSLNEFINDVPLLKNKTYHIVDEFIEKEGIIKYYTDYLGRVELVKTNLNECIGGVHELPKATKRAQDNINKANKSKGGATNDDGGHLIAHDYNGPDEAINIVPMPNYINRGEWLKMEQGVFVACWKKKNSDCIMSINYETCSYKPNTIDVRISDKTFSFNMMLAKEEQYLENLIKDTALHLKCVKSEPIYDGTYDWNMYHEAPVRLMIVMKEAYDEIDEMNKGYGGGWYITKDCFGKDDAWKNRSWQPLIYILYGLFNDKRYEKMDCIRNDKSMADVLKSIAYINTNKMPALTQTNDLELQANYEIWKPVLLKQIEIFNPQVILFANTFKLYKKDLVGESCQPTSISPKGSVHVYVKNGRILLDAYHPNQKTYGRSIYVNEIVDAIRNSLNS